MSLIFPLQGSYLFWIMTSLDPEFLVPSPTNNPVTSFVVSLIYCLPSLALIIQILTPNTLPWSYNMSCALLKIATYGLIESKISCNPCIMLALIPEQPDLPSAFSRFDNSSLVSYMYNWANFKSYPDGGSKVPTLWWLLPLIQNTYALLPSFTLLSILPPIEVNENVKL